MSQDNPIIIGDVGFTAASEVVPLFGNEVKEEEERDDILFLTPEEMNALGSESNNFQIVDEMSRHQNPDIQTYEEKVYTTGTFPKFQLDVGQVIKYEPSKNEPLSPLMKLRMQNGKQSKVWECGICSKEFGHQYTLMRHLPTHTDERKFQCNTCGKAFRQMSTLSQHRAIHSADRPYVCEVCQKTFNRVSTLISHRKTHTGLKPHRCHLCNKAFHQKGNLRNHIFTHTNERPYKCDICSKGFNQMSNLMCHKLKAHQRADKPRYVCQICGQDFQKRMGLRNHEQYHHGVPNSDPSTSSNDPHRYSSGVLVDPINTAAMQHALATNQTPFALLRPLNGIPVLVRVMAAGDHQMLIPATAEDLKKHGQITITPQVVDDANKVNGQEDPLSLNNKPGENSTELNSADKPIGSTVQIKIPVVATVVQKCGKDGSMCMAVQSPGQNNEEGSMNDNYYYTTTTTKDEMNYVSNYDTNSNGDSRDFQFINECPQFLDDQKPNLVPYGSLNSQETSNTNNYTSSIPILENTTASNMNISYIDSSSNSVISLSDSNVVLHENQVMYDNVDIENYVLE